MPHIHVNGVGLHYEETGDGPPLLLIPGLGAGRNLYAPIVPALAQRYRVIAVDNRGTGLSEVPKAPFTIEDMAADAAALLDHLGVGPVRAVGWSMGGMVLQSLLLDAGENVAAAVLLSTMPSTSDVQRRYLDAALALRATVADPAAAAIADLPWGWTAHTLTDHERVTAMLELLAGDPEPTSTEGWAGQAEAARAFDRRDELSTIAAPTLVLVGAEDVLTPPSQSIEIASRIPDAELVVLPRGGHAMLLEFPEATLRETEAFLARTGAPA